MPRWMRFAPSAYTARGGVGTVAAAATLATIRAMLDEERAAAAHDPAASDRQTPHPEDDRLAA